MYEGGILTQDGNPIDPDRLRAESFPEIRASRQHLESPNALDPKQVVEQGYDRIAERHLEWIHDIRVEERAQYTSVLLNGLPAGAEVLDLGCGLCRGSVPLQHTGHQAGAMNHAPAPAGETTRALSLIHTAPRRLLRPGRKRSSGPAPRFPHL